MRLLLISNVLFAAAGCVMAERSNEPASEDRAWEPETPITQCMSADDCDGGGYTNEEDLAANTDPYSDMDDPYMGGYPIDACTVSATGNGLEVVAQPLNCETSRETSSSFMTSATRRFWDEGRTFPTMHLIDRGMVVLERDTRLSRADVIAAL